MSQLIGLGAYEAVEMPFQQMGAVRPTPINFWEMSSPGAALYRHAAAMGQAPETETGGAFAAGVGAGVILLIVAVGFAVNYQIGKAMAPDEPSERKWAWGNAVGGTLFPPLTVGLALWKNYFRQ